MQVILLERIEKLGQIGDEVAVKMGYARNYLIPKGKALRATEKNRKVFAERRQEIEANNLKAKKEAEEVSKRIEGTQAIIVRQAAETGVLYGSVTSRDVADALIGQGVKVERSQVRLDNPIKQVGVFQIPVRLHADVVVHISINIAKSEEEALLQKQDDADTDTVETTEHAPENVEPEKAEEVVA